MSSLTLISSASETPIDCKKLSYTVNSFDHLEKWIQPLKNDPKELAALRTSFSVNATNLLFDQNSAASAKQNHEQDSQEEVKFSTTDENNFGNVSLIVFIKEGNLTKKKNLLSLISSKFEEKKQIFAGIECIEYGVDMKKANDRVDLICQLLRDISAFHNEAQRLNIKRHNSSSERIPSFLELCWWIAVSVLEDGPSHSREIRVDRSVSLSTLLLAEVLNECNIKAQITLCYTLISVGGEEKFCGNNVPMIIFSNADIDSALDACVNAAWFTEGLVPWATSCILVQESIYAKFIPCFKKRLLNSVENFSVLLTNPNVENRTQENVEKVLTVAKNHHLEVFQVPLCKEKRIPATLVIGDFVSCPVEHFCRTINKTLPILFVVPFRTANEGISMANSSPCKIAASVWSESYSTCLSSVSQLNFGTVWVNSYGVFDSLVPFFGQGSGCEAVRPTGIAYYHWNKSLLYQGSKYSSYFEDLPVSKNVNYSETEVQKILTAAHVAHVSWAHKDLCDRIKLIDQVWKHSSEPNSSLPLTLKKQLTDAVCCKVPSSGSFKVKDCSVSSSIEPIGVVIFIIKDPMHGEGFKKNILLKHVLSAIFSKNAVIVCGGEFNLLPLKSCLPENILSVTSKISLKNLCPIVQRLQLQANTSIWTLEGDTAKYYASWNEGVKKYYAFHADFDIRPHMVKRKVIWMPLA